MLVFTDLAWAAGGFMGTKIVGNFISPMLPAGPMAQPMMRIAIKAGVAYLTAWGFEMMMGRRVFMPVFLGGAAEVIQDTVRTFIAPMFPMLAQPEEQMALAMGAYPMVGAYPHVGEDPDQIGEDPDQIGQEDLITADNELEAY